jgi:hypothetical protein
MLVIYLQHLRGSATEGTWNRWEINYLVGTLWHATAPPATLQDNIHGSRRPMEYVVRIYMFILFELKIVTTSTTRDPHGLYFARSREGSDGHIPH